MKILELFAGTRSIGKAFEREGHEVFSVDWDARFDNIDYQGNVLSLFPDDIITMFGIPDVIWASPDCTTYSIAGIRHHRNMDRSAKSEYAFDSDIINKHLWGLIDHFLKLNPSLLYYVENPRGVYRKMDFVQDRPRYTVTYCQYGDKRMKPTDIFTNHPNPNFKPICKNGDPCHVSAPRGSQTGTQGMSLIDKSRIPDELCNEIAWISEMHFLKSK